MLIDQFWHDDPDAPFAMLLSMVETYCHPEAPADAEEALKRLVKRTDDPDVIRFKQELREALRDPSQLPEDALFSAAEYSDGSDEAFLRRLWRDLYGDEPVG